MSARQPFVPSGLAARPASRATGKNPPPKLPSFTPDRTNPLHSNAADKAAEDAISAAVASASMPQPLNLQNLMTKKKPIGGTHKIGSRRDSGPENIKDKQVPFPRRINTSTPGLHAPRPVHPQQTASPFFDPKDSVDNKDAHISTSFSSTEMFASPDRSMFSRNQSSTRNSNKRSRNDFDDDQDNALYDMSYGNPKRYKLDEATKYPTSYSPSRMSSPLAPSHHSEYQPSPQRGSFDRPDIGQYDQQPLSQEQPASQSQGDTALTKLLGRDADIYVEEHMDSYDTLTEKWKNCTMDEWVAGADTIMDKYVRILDFVKLHMTTKLKLFATFDKHVDSHNGVLDERAKVLASVQQRLVNESGSILGGAKGV